MPANKRVNFDYDTRGRLTSTSYGDASPGSTRTYFADGLLATAQTPTSTWTYEYGNHRLLKLERLAIDGAEYNFTRAPNAYGQAASQGYADGAVLQHSLNALGQPLALAGYADQIDWHPNGALHTYRLPNAGNRVHTVELNVRGLPETWVHSGVLSDTYTYDRNGNVKSITDQLGGTYSRAMTYDELDRLKTASGVWGSGSYSYDALDNLVSSTVGGRTVVATIGASNRLDALTINGTSINFSHDLNGNAVSRGGRGFVFDIGNRLQSAVGIASYTYDAHGRRVKTVSANGSVKLQFYSLSGQLLMGRQTSSPGAVTTERYVYLGGKLIATTHSQTGTRWEHADALGSPVAHVDASGAVTKTQFEPYGATAAGVNPNPMGFTGHVNDADTGLVYMQQRYYDPVAGRFLSVDPVTTDAKTGDSFNRYVYGNNNPYKYTDPDGRFAFLLPLIPIIFEAITAAVASNAGAAIVGATAGVAIGAAITSGSDKKAEAGPSAAGAGAPGPGGNNDNNKNGKGSGDKKEEKASEKTAKDIAKRVERDLGKDARQELHDSKIKGSGDRSLGELKSDAQALYKEAGKAIPDWLK